MKNERTLAGLRCGEVLESLSEYLDQSLEPTRVEAIENHLRGCDNCERFGGSMSALVTAIRERLAEPREPDPAVLERLSKRLDEL